MAAFGGHRESNMGAYTVDIAAVGFFILKRTRQFASKAWRAMES